MVDSLRALIKYNKRLMHLNLTNTGLTEYMIVQIGHSIRRAKSLNSVHLCSNPGSTTRVKEFLHKRVKCVPFEDQVKFQVSEIINDLTNQKTLKQLQQQLESAREAEGDRPVARETIKVKQNLERKRIYSLVNEFAEDAALESKLILTRVLGHRFDMPGSGQWRLLKEKHEDCWVCEQDVYGLIFWDPDQISA